MRKKLEIYNDIITIKLEVNQLPTFKIVGDYVKWGKDNNYPKELLNSYNNHPEHSAIVKGKARYLSGLKIKTSESNLQADQFLKKANRFDSWYQLRKKCDSDKAIYGGFAVQVTTNLLAQPVEFYHLDMGKLRLSADNQGVYYSDNWMAKSFELKKTFYPFFKSGYVGASIYFCKDFVPSVNELDGLYPVADYSSVLLDINTDIEISNFFNSLVKNGFSAGHIITFFSGKLTPEAKQDIEERFREKHQNTSNAGKVVLSFTNPDGKGAEVVNVTPNGLADQYELLNKRNQQKIITGHNVPGVLFKIKTEGTLGDRNEIDLAHELFLNEYAKIEQVAFNNFIGEMFKLKYGVSLEFEVEQVEPIGKELPLENQNVINALNARDPNIVTNYIIEKYGLKIDTIAPTLPNALPIQEEEMKINEHLKNLTGRQKQNLFNIANKLKKGDYTPDQALIMIKTGFGLSDADALKFLGLAQDEIQQGIIKVQQSDDKAKRFIEYVKLNLVTIDEEDELIDTEYVNFKDSTQLLQFELNKQRMYLAAPLTVSITDLRNGVLNILKGNPFSKPDEIAKSLDIAPDKISGALDWLTKKNLIEDDGTPTEKAMDKETEYKKVIYTVYRYDKRPDVKGPSIKPTSRQFCIDMTEATKTKGLTYEVINNYTNSFGDNAWDFRGGFYNDGTEITPWCRHIWVAETRIKKIKK